MDLDDVPKRQDDPLTRLERQPLDEMGLEELRARVARLSAEIARSEAAIAAKGASAAAAEAFFKKPG